MFLPYGTGCLLVRDGARLAAAHMGDAEYLRDFEPSERPAPRTSGPSSAVRFVGFGCGSR